LSASTTSSPATATLTIEQLKPLLASALGAQIITIVARTDARLRKTDNPFGHVEKITRVNGMVNWNYGRAVRNQQLREGSSGVFRASERAWGTRLKNSPFVEHKGELYLEVKIQHVLSTRYENAVGVEIAAEQLASLLPTRHSNAAHQGVEREVILRDYALRNIETITLAGATYKIAHATTTSSGAPAATAKMAATKCSCQNGEKKTRGRGGQISGRDRL
jgi:hypothetical protein